MKLRRHLANITYVSDEYPPFQKVLEVEIDEMFKRMISGYTFDAPYGWVLITGRGVLSYDEIDDSYFLFQYRMTSIPGWVVDYKVVLSGYEVDMINSSISRAANGVGSIYGLITLAEAFGLNHNLDRVKRVFENKLRTTDYVSWSELTREEIEEAADLYGELRKRVEEKAKEAFKGGD